MNPPYQAPTVIADQLANTGLPAAVLTVLAVLAAAVIILGAGLTLIARPTPRNP